MQKQLKISATQRSKSWVVLLALFYCFNAQANDYTYGVSNNAAFFGNTWSMTPKYLGVNGIDGMEISGVIYQYTAVKDLDDDFTVTVQNERADGNGYIIKDTEDWSQKYGMTIRKAIGLPYTPLANFKTDGGSIATTGTGSVENASVVYLHRFNQCFDPQSSVNCSGYVTPLPPTPPKFDLYDALEDDSVTKATKETDQDLIDKDEDQTDESENEEDEEQRLDVALSIGENALTLANSLTQSSILIAMNAATNLQAYYVAQIPSMVYKETLVLKDKGMKDNRRLFRSLTQDRQHNKMVEAQYQ